MTETRALAISLSNLKRAGPKDLLLTAQALEYLMSIYGSTTKVASSVGVSDQIVREFLGILKLPQTIQQMMARRELSTLEQAKKLRQLQRRRGRVLGDAAKAMAGLGAHDARWFANYLLRRPSATVPEALAAVRDAKGTVREEFHVVVILTAAEFAKVRVRAAKDRVDSNALVTEVIVDWLRREPGE